MKHSIATPRGPLIRAVHIAHDRLVFSRRIKVLGAGLAGLIPAAARSVLDVGCGDGAVAAAVLHARPDVAISGVDVLVRPHTHIAVQPFDGARLPFEDRSFDVVMFVDVLHHTVNPLVLLKEANRVARAAIVIKDHTREGPLAYATLRLMDWVGNAPHGVALPYNYWTRAQWTAGFAGAGISVAAWNDRLGLYAAPASWLFERNLHFTARLTPSPEVGS